MVSSSLQVRLRSVGSLMLLSPIPFVCLLVVLWRKWRGRASVGAFCASFLPSFEWWLFLVTGLGITVLDGGARTGLSALMAVLILLARERRWLCVPRWMQVVGVLIVLGWVGGAAYFQLRAGQDLNACLARYREDPQGITWRTRTPAGVFSRSVWLQRYNNENSRPFMLNEGHRYPLSVFAPWLYNALYVNPAEYFAVAEQVPGTPCYSTPKAPHVLVAKGDVRPSEEACALMEAQLKKLENINARPKYVPGRLDVWFPLGDDSNQLLPYGRIVFTAKDGNTYTLFSKEKPLRWR